MISKERHEHSDPCRGGHSRHLIPGNGCRLRVSIPTSSGPTHHLMIHLTLLLLSLFSFSLILCLSFIVCCCHPPSHLFLTHSLFLFHPFSPASSFTLIGPVICLSTISPPYGLSVSVYLCFCVYLLSVSLCCIVSALALLRGSIALLSAVRDRPGQSLPLITYIALTVSHHHFP